MRSDKTNLKEAILPFKIDKSTHYALFEKLMQEKKWSERDLGDWRKVGPLVEKMYSMGCKPVITVDPAYFEQVRKTGGRLQTKKALSITFGIEPTQEGEKLLLDVPLDRIAPVYDGPNDTFIGHVYIAQGHKVPLELLKPAEEEIPETEAEAEPEKPELKIVEETRESVKKIEAETSKKTEFEKIVDNRQFHGIADSKYSDEQLTEHKLADELIDDLYNKGIRPVIVVDEYTYNEALGTGLKPEVIMSDFKRNEKKQLVFPTKITSRLRASFGREPFYLGKKQKKSDRILMLDVPRERIKPFFGGPSKFFNGIVDITGGPVEPRNIKELTSELKVVHGLEISPEQQVSV